VDWWRWSWAKKDGAEASGGCGLRVSVASGRRIVVEAGFDAATCSAWCKCWRGCRVFGDWAGDPHLPGAGGHRHAEGFEGLYGLVRDRLQCEPLTVRCAEMAHPSWVRIGATLQFG
jgi:hypothetical protein